MGKYWWKILAALGVLFTIVYGLAMEIPEREILHQTMRNLFYHVPLWFAMTFALLISFIYSIKYLKSQNNEKFDNMAREAVNVALLFGILGFATGTVWGKYAWGNISAFMTSEPRILATLVAMLVYVAYVILRGSINEQQKRGKVAAVYNIFAFVMFIVFIYIIPRMVASMHPGANGNPAFNIYDTSGGLRPVFYTACVSWILVSLWILDIRRRMRNLEWKKLYQ